MVYILITVNYRSQPRASINESVLTMNYTTKTRGYSCIALHNPKTNANVGSALRACGVYDSSMLVISGKRYKKSCTDTFKVHRHMPVLQVEDIMGVIPYDCIPVAVELVEGASSLAEFEHPERAFYIFGAEDATLGKNILDKCKHTVYIPTNGCMNLAACVNVVLYDRMVKIK